MKKISVGKIVRFIKNISVITAIVFTLMFVGKLYKEYNEKTSIVSKNISYVSNENIREKTDNSEIKAAKTGDIVIDKEQLYNIESEESFGAESYIFPADGEIINEYSDNDIYYSYENGDYRSHSGIDISTNKKDVVAIDDGIIDDIYEDINLNYVVRIKHENINSIYKNIIINPDITVGKKVSRGESLGKGIIGDDGVEFIHFEIENNGNIVDPEKYFN